MHLDLVQTDWRNLEFADKPERVVSLVPSLTESLFELGAGGNVVGITDYCVYPPRPLARLRRVGGPKNPDLAAIRELQPELLIVSEEENRREDIEALAAEGIKVWVTAPRTVWDAINLMWDLVDFFRVPRMGQSLSALETAYEYATLALESQPPVRVFCPIWREPPQSDGRPKWWMTINADTYTHDMLRLCGGENIFADRARRYPLEADLGLAAPEPPAGRDIRYPRVRPEEVVERAPELILLPSEPYPFAEADRAALAAFPALPVVNLVEGTLLTWPGIRLSRALAELPSVVQAARR